MAVRKRNLKHEKQSKKIAHESTNEAPSSKVKLIGIIIGLIAIILFIKVQYTLIHSKMVEQGDYRPGPAIVTTWKGVSREWATSWIEYHAALGFTRLFIFWDDPAFDRDTIDYLKNDPVYSWVVDSYEPDLDYKSRFLKNN